MAEKTMEQLLAELAELKKQLTDLQAENDLLQEQLDARDTVSSREKQIAAKMNESGGALNREQAILSLDNQAAHDKAQKKGAKK